MGTNTFVRSSKSRRSYKARRTLPVARTCRRAHCTSHCHHRNPRCRTPSDFRCTACSRRAAPCRFRCRTPRRNKCRRASGSLSSKRPCTRHSSKRCSCMDLRRCTRSDPAPCHTRTSSRSCKPSPRGPDTGRVDRRAYCSTFQRRRTHSCNRRRSGTRSQHQRRRPFLQSSLRHRSR
jgi:hypothetical protein